MEILEAISKLIEEELPSLHISVNYLGPVAESKMKWDEVGDIDDTLYIYSQSNLYIIDLECTDLTIYLGATIQRFDIANPKFNPNDIIQYIRENMK